MEEHWARPSAPAEQHCPATPGSSLHLSSTLWSCLHQKPDTQLRPLSPPPSSSSGRAQLWSPLLCGSLQLNQVLLPPGFPCMVPSLACCVPQSAHSHSAPSVPSPAQTRKPTQNVHEPLHPEGTWQVLTDFSPFLGTWLLRAS